MADIKKWCLPEPTKKPVYAGIYPVVISMSRFSTKEVEKDEVKFNREVVSLTFTTLGVVPLPDGTNGKICVEQQYYFDVPLHVKALNGISRASGVPELKDTDELEAKTLMIGITNRSYEKEGKTSTVPQLGYGLFSYAPISEGSKIEFIANDFPDGNIEEEDYKKWFKDKIALYKQPK